MDPDAIVALFKGAVYLTMLVLSCVILPSLVVGVIISIFQAATQINESTLSFFPRFIVILLVLVWCGGWITNQLVEYARGLILDIPDLIG